MTDRQLEVVSKLVLSVAVCALGALAMYWTAGTTGIGWAILGLAVIWN